MRQHLLDLEQSSFVDSSFQKISRGRPILIYKLSRDAQRLFPSHDSYLLQEVIRYFEKTGNRKLIHDFFINFWTLRKTEFKRRLNTKKSQDIEARLRILKTMLQDEGFMPKICRSESGISIHECNCPYSEEVRATKLPCLLEEDFIRFALQKAVVRCSYIPSGEPTCSYVHTKIKRNRD